MDSSPDLSLKLRRGSSDSRDSFYMDFAQGIDSDIEELTTISAAPPPPPPPPPIPFEPPPPIPLEPEIIEYSPEHEIMEMPEVIEIIQEEEPEQVEELEELLIKQRAESPFTVEAIFPEQLPLERQGSGADEDEEETNTSVTVIPIKNKTPSSSSSSISSSHNELMIDDKDHDQDQDNQESQDNPPTPPPPLSPPKNLNFYTKDMRQRHFHSDSIDSINAMDCKIDDDNRDDSSPTDSMPPAPTPPPLPPLSLEKSGIMDAASQILVPSPSSPDNAIVSPESLSHHSSPAKSSRILHYAQHVTIDETRLPPSLRSSHHQLLQHSRRSTPSSPPPPFQSGHMSPTMSVLSNSLHRVDSSQALVPHQSSSVSHVRIETPSSSNTSPPPPTSTTTQHLSVLYQTHHHLHPILTSPSRRPSRLPDTSRFLVHQQALALTPTLEIKASDAFCSTLSALYGKILVVMGIAFPMAEVISTYIPPSFYEVFYLYLYIGSMLFLLFMYATLLWGSRASVPVTNATTQKTPTRTTVSSSTTSDSGEESDREQSESSQQSMRKSSKSIVQLRRPSIMAATQSQTQHYGSFYLRMGAVAFGIGSMIYSGLEFGQYFELERDTKCSNVLLALTPATRMAFIFIQMYFIFLNNEQIKVYRHKILARFGLMHMIGTNLSVWFSVLIQETKHEILTFYDPENRTLKISHRLGNKGHAVVVHAMDTTSHLRMARGLKGPHNIFECRRSNILGTLVQDASPFLFPCTIEYSLICAAILYVMWRNVSRPQAEPLVRVEGLHPFKRSPHHYSVDCAGAHKGLFVGILLLVLTIISLILFFVLVSRPEFVQFAVTEVNICELALYGTTTVATLVGMIQVRRLQYDSARNFSLDDILLVGGQTGSFLYSTFTIIGAHLTLQKDTLLILITAMASLFETAFQTMFILDASRRSAATPAQIRKKPGREIVTFLLVSNLAMWAINTLEKSRAESHPLQLHFYGLWAWTIITHVSMPLAIFYRFHSTVCLCEIWKRAYKMKPTYM